MTETVLDHIKEDALLQTRIRDLPIKITGTWLEKAITTLYSELDQKDIALRPECYLADEWFSPDGEPVIGIPFYLAHPRLIALEERMMLEAEGSSEEWCLRLLRHETAHALFHAYHLQKHHAWSQAFGNPKTRYSPETVRPRLGNRNFVTNLEQGYAQTHPEEDWAETFAVWLNPKSRWRLKYRRWPALKKIQFVEQLMEQVKQRRMPSRRGIKTCQAAHMRMQLGSYYAQKQSQRIR